MPVLTQRAVDSSSGMPGPTPSCQTKTLRSGASMDTSARNPPGALGPMSTGVRNSKEQFIAVVPFFSPTSDTRSDALGELDLSTRAAIGAGEQTLTHATRSLPDGAILALSFEERLGRTELVPAAEPVMPSVAELSASGLAAILPFSHEEDDMDGSPLSIAVGDIIPHHESPTYVPIMGGGAAPASPAVSSAPCSPASSINFSGPCSSVVHSSSCRFTHSSGRQTSSSGAAIEAEVGGFTYLPVSRAGGLKSVAAAEPQPQPLLPPPFHHTEVQYEPNPEIVSALQPPAQCTEDEEARTVEQQPGQPEPESESALSPLPPSLPSLSHFVLANSSTTSSRRSSLRDQNSVTIKATTVVKDAAGAIDKILSRGVTALVTALRSGNPPYTTPYDSLNQAVKAIAVARQYAKETGPEGAEVTFLPFHRYDNTERPDPNRFAFLVFPVPRLAEALKTADETVLNVARGSDVHKMAGAIIAVMLDRGQAVMKAAGSDAIFVAMSAVVNARHRLVQKHGFDLMLAAAWITEDTVSTMGRESKFLRFNILKTEPAGPKGDPLPALQPGYEAC